MHDSNPKVLLYVGYAAVALGFCMTFEFGRSMSLLHAGAMGLLTIAAAFMWPEVDRRWRDKRKISAGLMTAAGILFVGVELFSHLGYTVGHRIRDAEEATVQNARYSSAQEAVSEDKTNLAMWQERLKKLEGEYAWLPTVTSEALQARLASANLAIEQESKRGGCGPKCLERTKERDEIASRMNLARERADLTGKIEATKRVLAGARDKADTTEFKTSKIISQTKFVSQLATFELEPGKAALTWAQIGIGFLVALVTTFLGPVCIYLSGHSLGSLIGREPQPQGRPEAMPAPSRNPLEHFLANVNRHVPDGVPKLMAA